MRFIKVFHQDRIASFLFVIEWTSEYEEHRFECLIYILYKLSFPVSFTAS